MVLVERVHDPYGPLAVGDGERARADGDRPVTTVGAGSIRQSVPAVGSVTHTAPAPAAMPPSENVASFDPLGDLRRPARHPQDRVVAGRDPHAVTIGRQRSGRQASRACAGEPVRPRVEARDGPRSRRSPTRPRPATAIWCSPGPSPPERSGPGPWRGSARRAATTPRVGIQPSQATGRRSRRPPRRPLRRRCRPRPRPPPAARSVGSRSDATVFSTRRLRGVDLGERAVVRVEHPHAALAAAMLDGVTPTGMSATIRSVPGSITATEFGATVVSSAPFSPPLRASAAATIATSRSAPPATIKSGPRRRGCAARRAGRPRRELESGVLSQDRGLQFLERRPGLQAELLDQGLAPRPVGLERLGLAPGAIQRQHQLAAQPLAQRMLGARAPRAPGRAPRAALAPGRRRSAPPLPSAEAPRAAGSRPARTRS